MNATYDLDHLTAVHEVAAIATAALGSTASAIKPKSASTSHYDVAGATVAGVSQTSYDGVVFANGAITGGSLAHQSFTPDQRPLSTTSMAFQGGKPASANVTIHNLYEQGDFKKISMDMSAAAWNEQFAIQSGQVRIQSTNAQTQTKTHEGTMLFDKEAPKSASFTHYDPAGSGAVSGYSEVDYTKAAFTGSKVTGGQFTLNTMHPDKSPHAASTISVSPLGSVHTIETTNMASPQQVKSKVLVDATGIQFNARNEFDSGNLLYTVNDPQGAVLSKSTVTYKNSCPAQSQTEVYSGGQLQSKIMTDFSASRFNNQRQVVNSTKKVDIFSADNKLVQSLVVAYDAQGNKLKGPSAVQVQPPVPPGPAANAPAPVLPATAHLYVKDVPADISSQRPERRPDGTLAKVLVTELHAGKVIFSEAIYYAADGTTVVKIVTMDLSGATYDLSGQGISGEVKMKCQSGAKVLQSYSSVQY